MHAGGQYLFKRLCRGVFTVSMVASLLACTTQQQREAAVAPPNDEWPEVESSAALDFIGECRNRLATARERFETLETRERPYDTQSLLKAINRLDIVIDSAASPSSLYFNVHPDPQVREAANACQQKFVELISEIGLSRPLYNRLARVDINELDKLDRRYVMQMREDFERAGVSQDAATRMRIRTLNEQINKLGQDFNRNIREDVRKVTVESVEHLAGLPQDFIDAHEPDEQGRITITTDYPDYLPVMQYAHDDALRLELYKAFRNRGYPANEAILKELLRKRYELAQLLGYENFAQYVTEDKMIETPANAQNFIDKVSTIATPRANAEYAVLLERLREEFPGASEVGDWQKTYLENQVKKEQYDLDSQAVRQYFRYDAVRDGIFDLTETLFDVDIRPWDTQPWHPSVETYEIWDHDELIGRFYLDMHPREGKYNHAAAFDVQDGVKGVQIPVKALVCNFPGGDDGPGYMEHGQVETFLHEFGHLLHGIFGGHQPWMALSGIKTEWDFVEAPSQMLEEWVWDADTLKTFASNSQGELIPGRMVRRMNAARDFGRGLWTRHQMFYAAVSLNFYNRDPDTFEFVPLMRDLQEAYSPFDYVDDTYFHASFGHLYGYSSIYYTYMWSLVIASDMFSEFKQQGLRDPAVAQRYRHAVLEPGGTKDAAELVEDFLGRPYSFRAFAQELEEGDLEP